MDNEFAEIDTTVEEFDRMWREAAKGEVMKYRKKPVVIEAVWFDGSSTQVAAIQDWIAGQEYVEPIIATRDLRPFIIETLEGPMTASPGDWVIKGVAGEFYPCRDDIFRQTYEPVE